MIIKGLQRLTLVDYPGQLACTIFTFGCNFRCPFCFNASLVIGKPEPNLKEREVFEFLRERKDFLTGVCITGGEPTLHPDLLEFISKIKQLGYLVKLDTNGTRPEAVEQLVEARLLDYIALDIKAPWERYAEVVKAEVDVEAIKRTLKLLIKSGVKHEVRTTVVRGVHTKADVVEIAKHIEGVKRYYLQSFLPLNPLDPSFAQIKPFRQEELEEFKRECERYVPTLLRSYSH